MNRRREEARQTGSDPKAPEARARRSELLAEERNAARQMLARLRDTSRLEKSDRPVLARNLGRMIESVRCNETRRFGVMRQMFEIVFKPDGAESALKKRARYARFADEALPYENLGYGEYAADGRTFAHLAGAFADAVHGPGNEDARLDAVLRLLERSSLDHRQACLARGAIVEREALKRAFDQVHDAVRREADLIEHFRSAARWPLVGVYDLAEAAVSALGSSNLHLLEGELKAAGIDATAADVDTLRRQLAGKTVLGRWHFMADLEPRDLVIRREFPTLDPSEFVPGGPLWRLHRNLPRIPIGHVYHPGIARCIDLDQRLDRYGANDEALLDVLHDAHQVFDTVPRHGAIDPLPTWSQSSRSFVRRCVYERVIFRRECLYLSVVPSPQIDGFSGVLHFEDNWDNLDYLNCIGSSINTDQEIFLAGDGGSRNVWYVIENNKTVVFEGEDTPAELVSNGAGILLTEHDAVGQNLLLKPRLCCPSEMGDTSGSEGISIAPDDLRSGRVPLLVRPSFVDPAGTWTPFPQTSLAAAIVRNLTAAPPEQRLDHLLAQQARRLVEVTERFLADQRSTFDRAWER